MFAPPPAPCVIPLSDGHAADRAAHTILTGFPGSWNPQPRPGMTDRADVSAAD